LANKALIRYSVSLGLTFDFVEQRFGNTRSQVFLLFLKFETDQLKYL
jgi:hypothetical protein